MAGADGGRRAGFAIGIAVLILLLAGGAVAAALLLSGDDEAKNDGTVASTTTTTTVPESSDPATTTTASGDSSGSGSAPTAATPSPSVPPQVKGGGEIAAAGTVFLDHWQAISDQRYSDAYSYFYSAYTTSESEWISTHAKESPKVNVSAITINGSNHPALPGELWMDVRVPVEDRGGDSAGNCRIIFGAVRMFREGGEWRYRPGEYQGVDPSFANDKLGGGFDDVPDSDPRCP